MLIYFFLALLLFITSKKKSPAILLLICALLFIVTAFRGYSVGTDTLNYQMLFTGEATVDKSGEYAFLAIYGLLNSMGLDYRWFLIVTATLFWGQLLIQSYIYMKKMPIFPIALVFYLGYCFMFFNISRQMISVVVGMWLFYMIDNKFSLWYIIPVIFISSLFHTSGLILFFVLLIRKVCLPVYIIIFLLLLTFVLPFIFPMSMIIDSFTSRIGLLERFTNYILGTNKSAFSANRLLMNLLYIIFLLKHKIYSKDLFFKCIIFGLIILNSFPTSSFVTRSGIYFLMCQIVFLPKYYVTGDRFDKNLVWIYSFAVLISFLYSNNGGIVPYTMG